MPVPELLAGRYELRGLLGCGGMGEIHDGWDTRLGRPVAVKVLRGEFGRQPDVRRRFEAEARAAANLTDPHIVAVHDSGEDAGVPYIVMERLPGRTLADEIALGPMPEDRVRAILIAVVAAVAAAHDAGILHRDIKPGNILFTETGTVKVTDFGIAKSAGEDYTRTGELVGTVAYLSPDRLSGTPASVTDDLYAAGAVGYEALTGRKPYDYDNLLALARAITQGPPPPLATARPDVDSALVAVIERAMAREPEHRFGSARDMLAALREPHLATLREPHLAALREPHRADPVTEVIHAPTRGFTVAGPPVPAPVPTLSTFDAAPDSGRRRILLAIGLTAAAVVALLLLAWGQGGDTPPVATPGTSSVPATAPTPVGSVGSPTPSAVDTGPVFTTLPVPAPAPAPAQPPAEEKPPKPEKPSNDNGNGGGNNSNSGNNGGGNNGGGNNGGGNGR
ncbi:serine/threonine-protein kinase [Rhodococcus aetherivorans]|uniref:non-specific serine/threonine protein kinase n=1 Tax=Rhodococcus aetherivorans TaxID=191292 RepID=A0AA46SDA0_9NOCA|nr:serine/threonine-protein kinase [Rhodococcus aetherivorans]UYF93559.1 serine/threonine protein kinase [Rhodococcus aetherivorans]CCW13887.1 serine/threonine protein kinase [Rhodococcus aetherivorans]